MDYESFIDSHGFHFFKGTELTRLAKRVKKGIQNSEPHRSLWRNVIPTLMVADIARERFGSPILITSAYRNPSYNAVCGGVRHSQHQLNRALDLVPRNGDVKGLHKVILDLHKEGLFNGGIGKYNSFVHIDTRGKNADW